MGNRQLFLACQERDQIDELGLGQALLQAFGHRTDCGRVLLVDVGSRHDMLLALIVSHGDGCLRFRKLDAVERFTVLERDRQRSEARCDRSARLKEFCQRHSIVLLYNLPQNSPVNAIEFLESD